MTDLEEKRKAYKEAQVALLEAVTAYEMARLVMPERLAYVKAQTIRNRAWEAYIEAGGSGRDVVF